MIWHTRRLFAFASCALIGCLGLLAAPQARAGQIIDTRAVTQTVLPNGLRVVIKEAPSINLVALNVWVRAGSSDETEANSGVSHYLEHMVFKGSKKRGPGDFDMEVEGLGGMANAVTMEDATQYYVVVARPYADRAIAALGDVLSNPSFPEEEVKKEQQIIRDELKRADENAQEVASRALNRLEFQQHPYRMPTAGTEDSVGKMTRQKILDFYNRNYVAANMSLVVVGAVKASEVLPKIQAAFGGLRPGPAPERAHPAEPMVEQPRIETLTREGLRRSYLMMGFRAPGMDTKEDVCAMDVLLYVLGEQRGQSGRLNRELRQRRNLVSSIYSDYVTLREPGTVSFWAETSSEQLDRVRDAILEQLALVRDTPVPDDEIRRAKALLLGVYTLDNETYDGQAGTLGFYEAKDTYRFALDYEDRILKVTAADVQRVAQRYFGANSYCLVKMVPKPSTGETANPAQNALAPVPAAPAAAAGTPQPANPGQTPPAEDGNASGQTPPVEQGSAPRQTPGGGAAGQPAPDEKSGSASSQPAAGASGKTSGETE